MQRKVDACRRVPAWALLTLEERLELRVDICALLRDVEVTGELVRELPTRLDDGALGTQTVGSSGPCTRPPAQPSHTRGHCCACGSQIPRSYESVSWASCEDTLKSSSWVSWAL